MEIHLSAVGWVSQPAGMGCLAGLTPTPNSTWHMNLGAHGKEDVAVVKLTEPES